MAHLNVFTVIFTEADYRKLCSARHPLYQLSLEELSSEDAPLTIDSQRYYSELLSRQLFEKTLSLVPGLYPEFLNFLIGVVAPHHHGFLQSYSDLISLQKTQSLSKEEANRLSLMAEVLNGVSVPVRDNASLVSGFNCLNCFNKLLEVELQKIEALSSSSTPEQKAQLRLCEKRLAQSAKRAYRISFMLKDAIKDMERKLGALCLPDEDVGDKNRPFYRLDNSPTELADYIVRSYFRLKVVTEAPKSGLSFVNFLRIELSFFRDADGKRFNFEMMRTLCGRAKKRILKKK